MDDIDPDDDRGPGNPILALDGRLLIPQEIRNAAGLVAGDVFEIELVDGAIVLRPVVADEAPAEFWGPNWREKLDAALADVDAGRTTFHASTEEFLAARDARTHADARRDR